MELRARNVGSTELGTQNVWNSGLMTRRVWNSGCMERRRSGTLNVWNSELGLYGTQKSGTPNVWKSELRMCRTQKVWNLKCIVSEGRNSECICLRYCVARMRPMCCVARKRQKYSVVMWLMYVVNACDQKMWPMYMTDKCD